MKGIRIGLSVLSALIAWLIAIVLLNNTFNEASPSLVVVIVPIIESPVLLAIWI